MASGYLVRAEDFQACTKVPLIVLLPSTTNSEPFSRVTEPRTSKSPLTYNLPASFRSFLIRIFFLKRRISSCSVDVDCDQRWRVNSKYLLDHHMSLDHRTIPARNVAPKINSTLTLRHSSGVDVNLPTGGNISCDIHIASDV